jgi:hypothetical protein
LFSEEEEEEERESFKNREKELVMRAEVLIAQTHDVILSHVVIKNIFFVVIISQIYSRYHRVIIRPAHNSLRFRWRRSISSGRHVRYRLLPLRLHVFGALFVPEVGENAEQTQRGDIDDAGERGDF